MKKKIEYICDRELTPDKSDDEKLIVLIGKPKKVRDDEFACPFQLVGLDDSSVRYAYGIDSFQALIQALEGIRTTLDRTEKKYHWFGSEKDDHGFPRYICSIFGLKFSRRIDKILEHEISSFVKKKIKRRKKKVSGTSN